MKTIKGLRFYTYQEAAHWLEGSATEVEEMVAHRQLLAYRFRSERTEIVDEAAPHTIAFLLPSRCTSRGDIVAKRMNVL
jgi:hypothetical protein